MIDAKLKKNKETGESEWVMKADYSVREIPQKEIALAHLLPSLLDDVQRPSYRKNHGPSCQGDKIGKRGTEGEDLEADFSV